MTTQRRTAVKVCGLTWHADALAAADAGAEYLGVIFAGGPRQQSVDSARGVFGDIYEAKRVGVFGTQSVDEIVETGELLALDVIQLHAATDARHVELLQRQSPAAVWPVVRIDASGMPVIALELARTAGWLLLDSKVTGQLGGTGQVFDWAALAGSVDDLRANVPGLQIVLAGGLRATNVHAGIAILKPDVVDVSSGVERATGIKDHEAVRTFVDVVNSHRGTM